MTLIRAFNGLRPSKNIVEDLSSPPYDVIDRDEAKSLAKRDERSLLNIIKSEICFDSSVSSYDERVYQKAADNFIAFQDRGWLEEDSDKSLYIYSQSIGGKVQYGVVAAASVDDYNSGVIKKHELTRAVKELDRINNIDKTDANLEPVFLSYRAVDSIDEIVAKEVMNEPEYCFTSDGVEHTFWKVSSSPVIDQLVELFSDVQEIYIADGHHRSAAAAAVANKRRETYPEYSGEENFNFFMAVYFPSNQLQVFDYNRVVKNLNGLTSEQFLELIKEDFDLICKDKKQLKPSEPREFSIYLDRCWYLIKAKEKSYDRKDLIGSLDVSILSSNLLDRLLGIKDLRTDKRIDFVGGIRGLEELERRVDSGEMKVAFALYPVSMDQIMAVSDSGDIMPPKTTWFEPKLRSGLVIHKLS